MGALVPVLSASVLKIFHMKCSLDYSLHQSFIDLVVYENSKVFEMEDEKQGEEVHLFHGGSDRF